MDGLGGTYKTCLYGTMRSGSRIAVAVASFGFAACLPDSGSMKPVAKLDVFPTWNIPANNTYGHAVEHNYCSADSVSETDNAHLYTVEFLNS